MAINYFRLNADNIILTTGLYEVLIKDLEEYISTSNTEDNIRIKQQITLDVIMKTQILIESALVLIHSLSTGYSTVARNMTYYNMDLVNNIIKEITKGKKLKNYKYNIRKALGLPNLRYLLLSHEEKRFLNEDFVTGEYEFIQQLKQLAAFYDKFRVVYGKSKHGLVYIAGGLSNPKAMSFDQSILQCFGRISKEDKRPRSHITPSSFDTTPSTYRFFNLISVVKFDKGLIEEINQTLSTLKSLISIICSNHVSYALNCGKRYLPHSRRDGKDYMLTFREAHTEDEREIVRNIAQKNLGQMYRPNVKSIIQNIYNNPKIIESLEKETVTNIIIPNSHPI
jgi:hypothetical protein